MFLLSSDFPWGAAETSDALPFDESEENLVVANMYDLQVSHLQEGRGQQDCALQPHR